MNQPHRLKDLLQPQMHALVEHTVTQVADGDLSPDHGWLRLHLAGLHPDRGDLDDAVTAMTTRDGLLSGVIDPYDLHEIRPSVHVRNVRDWAADQADQQLGAACTRMVASGRSAVIRDVLETSMRSGPSVTDHNRTRISSAFAEMTDGGPA